MGDYRKDGGDSGGPPLGNDPGQGKNPDPGHVLIRVIQLLTALAAAIHEVSRLLDR